MRPTPNHLKAYWYPTIGEISPQSLEQLLKNNLLNGSLVRGIIKNNLNRLILVFLAFSSYFVDSRDVL